MLLDAQFQFQSELYRALKSDTELSTMIGEAIYDASPPLQQLPDLYIRLGNETIQNTSSKTHLGIEIIFEISVFSKMKGFSDVKKISSEIVKIVCNTEMELSSAKVVGLWFKKSQSYRQDRGNLRQIKLLFKTILDVNSNKET